MFRGQAERKKERKIQRDLPILKWGLQERRGLFIRECNNFKLKEARLRLDIIKKHFMVRVVKH